MKLLLFFSFSLSILGRGSRIPFSRFVLNTSVVKLFSYVFIYFLFLESLTSFICIVALLSADTDTILQLNIASNNKELSTEVKKELAAEGHPNSSTSLAKVKHDDLKDSGSSSKTRGNNDLTINLNDMSISSKPHSVVTGKSDGATSSSKNKPQKTVQAPQTEDNFNQLNLAIVSPLLYSLDLMYITLPFSPNFFNM